MRKPYQVEGIPDKRSVGLPHGVETDDYVFVASMALHPTERRRDDNTDTIAQETKVCLDRMETKLGAVGCSLQDVVKMTVYLSDRNYQREFMEVYNARWEYGNHPMRTTLFVGLALDCRVELDAIAVKPNRES